MTQYTLRREQWIDRDIESTFAFFADAANLEAITPPWLHFQIISRLPIEMKPGALIEYRLRWRVIPIHWITEITCWEPPYRFVDQQKRGPYSLWHHTHTFEPHGARTLMRDTVEYRLPLGPLGRIAHQLKVRRDLDAIFDYRANQVTRLIAPLNAPE